MIAFARRTQALQAYFFAELEHQIVTLRSEGRDIIRLDIGSPDLPPPPPILEALSASAQQDGHHGYTSHRGTTALRKAWADYYQRAHLVELDPEAEILPLLGSKEGIFHLTQVVLDPGDVALVPDPGYPTYTSAARFAGAEDVPVPLLPQAGFLPDLDRLSPEMLRRARVLWLNYPNNPTGATADLAFLQTAVDVCRRSDVLLCHDAAYAAVTFDGYRAPSVLEIPGASEIAVEFNTLSKSHNMAGWRVGVAVGNRQVLARLLAIKTHADSGHFRPALDAATTALSGDQSWLADRNRIYQDRRDRIVSALRGAGFSLPAPRGSLYVWLPLPEGWGAVDFCSQLLHEALVSVTPGVVFGNHGEGYVRLSLAAPTERVAEAMDRLTEWWPSARPAT